MPELPEVETVRRGLAPVMEGARFRKVEARRADLRFPLPKDFVKRLEGKAVQGLGRRAKYLLVDLSSGEVLLMHLGMSGSFRVAHEAKEAVPGDFHHPRGAPGKHDHVVFHMTSGAVVTFNDPRRFGSMKLVPRAELEHDPLVRALGPEPLGNAFDAAVLARACRGRKTSLKAALSDQRVVAGLGNIYVNEILFAAGIRPSRRASRVTRADAERIVAETRRVLAAAIELRGSSISDYRDERGEPGAFQLTFRVYERAGEPCRRCRGVIRRCVIAGRSSFYCSRCQR